jgi:hypothetical protein
MDTPNILNSLRLPARIDSQQAGEILGMSQVEILILVSVGLLKPIGITTRTGSRFFASVELEALARDRSFLDRAQRAINRHWQEKNHGR